MFKNKFSLKIATKIIITIIVVLVATTTIYLLTKQIKKMNASMAEKKEMDYLISNRESVNNKIKTDLMAVDPAYEEKINAALPSVYDILPFVDAMDSLSKKYNLKQTINFSQPASATDLPGPIPVTLISFNLDIEGANISNLTDYLKDFEKLPYFASMDSMTILANGKTGWDENSSIIIIGSLYAHE